MTCAFGMNFSTILYRGQTGRDEWFSRAYVDAFEPASDVFVQLLAALYTSREPRAVLLGTVPENRSLSILLTHDIDYQKSIPNARVFAEYERSLGISATYFLQTKIVRDDLDSAFLNPATVPQVQALANLGHEVASHSVSHSRLFADFPMGDGTEQYPGYRPFVHNAKLTTGGTILGELRVSKHLIDSILPKASVVAFRPGYLADPFSLPQALQATGYRYVSSLTAAGALTHLPFRQCYERLSGQELDLWEFPVTFSDGQTDDLLTRLPVAMDVARQVARYGGLFVVLIHPNNVEDKLRFEQAFVPEWRGKAWFGTLGDFGRWWEARDSAGVDVAMTGTEGVLALTLAKPVQGLVLKVPTGWIIAATPGVVALAPGVLSVTAPAGAVKIAFRLGGTASEETTHPSGRPKAAEVRVGPSAGTRPAV